MRLAIFLGFTYCVGLFGQTPTPPFRQCPAVGLDTSCRILIVIDATGAQRILTDASVSATFDGNDDTLIGVVNMSPNPVSSIPLTAATDIFGFDGDGVCAASIVPHPAACPFGPTGYEGPGVSFASITNNNMTGVVNFNPPLAPNGGSTYFGLEEAIPSTCPDADGDGLCDDWEINGLTVYVNGSPVFLNLPAMGADPRHKDIFIQSDYMTNANHTHQPRLDAIAMVTQAFANAPVPNPDGTTGITLHVDCGPNCIMNPKNGATWTTLSRAKSVAHQDMLGASATNLGAYIWAGFDAIKQAGFPAERQQVFHYVVFSHLMGGQDSYSGLSRGLGASDFIVSLGGADKSIGTTLQQAGTLMHELGHNLGLYHGGFENTNFKAELSQRHELRVPIKRLDRQSGARTPRLLPVHLALFNGNHSERGGRVERRTSCRKLRHSILLSRSRCDHLLSSWELADRLELQRNK